MLIRFFLFLNVFVLLSAQILPPTNLTAENVGSTFFTLTWNVPDDSGDYTYAIAINLTHPAHYVPEECPNSHDFIIINSKTKNTHYTRWGVNTDYEIKVVLTAYDSFDLVGNRSENVELTFNTSEGVSDVVTNLAYLDLTTIEKNNVNLDGNLIWNYPCTPNGLLTFKISLSGVYTENETMLDVRNITVDNIAKFEQSTNLKGMLKYSYNYSAEIFAVTSQGESEGVEISFLTDPNYPDEPKITNITDTGTEMEIQWDEPENKMGKIINYHLNVVSLGPIEGSYDCEPDLNTTNYTSSYNTLNIPVRPYYTYNIIIQGETKMGKGKTVSKEYNTSAIAPPLPTEVNITDSTLDIENNIKLDFNLSFTYPCATNGILNYTIVLEGKYTDGGETKTREIPWESDISNTTKEKVINITEFLDYAYEYTLTIYSNETVFSSTNFTTSDNYPNAPVLELSDNGLEMDLTWTEPKEKMGKILFYDLEIVPLGVKENALDCNGNNKETNIQISDNSYKLNIRSYYDYNVTIKGNTSVGWGKSFHKKYSTQENKPENIIQMKNQIKNFSDNTTSDYKVEAFISFQKPCRTNGPFKNYEFTYVGTRKNNRIQNTVTLDKVDLNSYNFCLKPGYNYTVEVYVNNDKFKSNVVNVQFTAPSGVPKQNNALPIDLQVSSDKAILTLNKNYFSDEYGDNLYYAIILSDENIESAEHFSLWNGTTWPELNNDNEIYITEEFWEPFKDDTIESVDVEITKNITQNTKYFMVIRAFTSYAYTDSKIIEFSTKIPEVQSDLGLILGLSIGLSAVFIVFIGVAIYCLRKHNVMAFGHEYENYGTSLGQCRNVIRDLQDNSTKSTKTRSDKSIF